MKRNRVRWEDKLQKYKGREVYACKVGGITGTRINLNPDDLSFCHDAEIVKKPHEISFICKPEDFSVERYYDAVSGVIEKFQNPLYECRSCSKCTKERFKTQGIRFVTICTSMFCNSACIYCSSHTKEKKAWNPLPVLEALKESDCFDSDCFFDWGGGEPTENPFFPATVKYLIQNDYRQRINTNAINFSEEASEALKSKKVQMRISADSGTREGYYRVKGTDNYELFWHNVGHYCDISDNIHLKYNLFNENSADEEINGFLQNCESSGVRNIIIDAEITAYQRNTNAGPFYFRKKEFDAAHMLQEKAVRRGFNVEISSYAFGTRPFYDSETGKLDLPTMYYDNIDKEVLCEGVFLKTFSTGKQLVDYILQDDGQLVLFGAGRIGYKATRLFNKYHVQYDVIDSFKNGYDDVLETRVYSAERYLSEQKGIVDIVITMKEFEEALKQLNEMKVGARVLWLRDELYDDDLNKTFAT